MRLFFSISVLGLMSSTLAAQERSTTRPPVFDVHLHSPFTAATVKATLSAMDSLNVLHAVFIGSSAQIATLPDTSTNRLLASLMFPCEGGRMPNAGVQCFAKERDELPDIEWLRSEVRSGRIRVLGEIGAQYLGMRPDDSRLAPYYALAEELDVPVGIHLGIGPPGVSYSTTRAPALKSPNYRGAAGDPYLLEDVLLRHPKLRLYVMHAAWPNIEHMTYMLYMHPQLYVDVSVLQYAIPHDAYMSALKTLVDAGFGERIMFGSDGGPNRLAAGIEAIEQAPFLSAKQKRDILYDNAMRFFRLNGAAMGK